MTLSLAPENPYPAAVHDCWEALLWLLQQGPSALSINPSRIATGGSSAGGNLAAIMTHKALTLSPPVHFQAQLLSVPVTDNTATVANNESYRRYEHTAALPAPKMIWYRDHYLPNEADRTNPEASPLFYTGDWAKLPRRWSWLASWTCCGRRVSNMPRNFRRLVSRSTSRL